MLRRDFISLNGVTAMWPLAGRTQQSDMPKVGYVWVGERGADVSGAGLRQGLADRGYTIGRNLAFEDQYAQGSMEKVPALIAELLALKVDVLVTAGTSASLAAPVASGRKRYRTVATFRRLQCKVARIAERGAAEITSCSGAVEFRQSQHPHRNGSVADSGAEAGSRFDRLLG
jgi:hypothetical protein